MWRDFNYAMLKHLDETYDGIIIVPMTVVNPQYFEEIIGRLRGDGVEIVHYALCATEETLMKRLRGRGERKNSWPIQQIKRCVAALSDERFGHHLQTDHSSIMDNVEHIAVLSNIQLLPDQRSSLKRSFDRVITQVKHIRF